MMKAVAGNTTPCMQKWRGRANSLPLRTTANSLKRNLAYGNQHAQAGVSLTAISAGLRIGMSPRRLKAV